MESGTLPIMNFNPETLFAVGPVFYTLFLKVLFLIVFFLYTVFAFIMIRQVKLMGQTVQTALEPVLFIIALGHFIMAAGLFVLALLLL
jgi:ABC-type Na+ efflux pump permease subunit